MLMASLFSQNVKLMRYPHHSGFTHGMVFGGQVANIFLNPKLGSQPGQGGGLGGREEEDVGISSCNGC